MGREMTDQVWTIGALLAWTTEYLKKSGSQSPRLDAEVLLAEARGCPRIELYTDFDQQPEDAVRTAFRELVRRRAEGMPVAYLVGRREFYSLSFRVTPDVLVPRPETEFVVVALLDAAAPPAPGEGADDESGPRGPRQAAAAKATSICDVGTGSGILAICAAIHLPAATVTAIDISPAALAIARENAATHQVAARIDFREGDLLEGLPDDSQFNWILSNPPYITEAEYPTLPRDVMDHEPRVALVGGPTGVELTWRLIDQARTRLTPGGRLILEIHPDGLAAVRGELERQGYRDPRVIKDLAGLPRVISATWGP